MRLNQPLALTKVLVARDRTPDLVRWARSNFQRRLVVLKESLFRVKRLAVLTGAGLSTASGIPDYRSKDVGRFVRTNLLPVQYADFLKDARVRRIQWARNYVAWPHFCRFQPNEGHLILKNWELENRVHWLITQNVDSLHQKAGSVHLTELHGTAYRVRCLGCHRVWPRSEFQFYLNALNPFWYAEAAEIAPDGDADLPANLHVNFKEPRCHNCGSIVKPDMTFFGECVPQETVDFVQKRLDECDGILVLGTSLEVFSSYRFVCYMKERGKPIFIVNLGPTRADPSCSLKLDAKINEVLKKL